MVSFIDYIIETHFSAEDDFGALRPLVSNPFERIRRGVTTSETVRSPLPYRYIQQLRQILCPYEGMKKESHDGFGKNNPWANRHFRDWSWAHENEPWAWFEIDPDMIDRDDPDCVWRSKVVQRKNKKVTIKQMWSPVIAMVIFVKLHLPLRTYQVRFLDSGEADTWRYEDERWTLNTYPFTYGTKKRPYAKGVFRRTYDATTETYATALYVSTNKTSDQNKSETDFGYTIPWQHEELLYWLEKLRNWQEKYNPISGAVCATELNNNHFGKVKHRTTLKPESVRPAPGSTSNPLTCMAI